MKAILLFFFTSSFVYAETTLPDWITHQKLSDEIYQYVICSHEDKKPELAKKEAEISCLANVMKLSGVRTIASEKMELSLDGNKFNSNVSTDGVEGNVKCEFTDIYNQEIDSGFRVWLKCRIKKDTIIKYSRDNINGEVFYGPKPLFDEIRKLNTENKKLKSDAGKITVQENGKIINTSVEKLVNKYVFNGMTIHTLMKKINAKFLIYHAMDPVCQKAFGNDEMYKLNNVRICVSAIDGIVIGVCDDSNKCNNL